MAELGMLGSFIGGIVFLIVGRLILHFKGPVSKIFFAKGTMYHPEQGTVIFTGWLAFLFGAILLMRGLYLLIF